MNTFTNVHTCDTDESPALPTSGALVADLLAGVADDLDRAAATARRVGALVADASAGGGAPSGELEQLMAQRLVDQWRSFRHGGAVFDLWRTDLWRALGFRSWRTFAEQELGVSKTRSYQLVALGQVRDVLGVEVSEAQARPLAPLLDMPDVLRAAWARAVDIAGQGEPTGAVVADAVAESEPTT